MRVDEVDRCLSVEPRHLRQQASVEPPPRVREAEISGYLRISHPLCGSRQGRRFSTMVERGYGNDAGDDSKLLKLPGRFRNEATANLIASGGEKWRQG